MRSVSVVMPTYNRWDQLEVALDALARQDLPHHELEVVVVSDGSTDGTDEHLRCRHTPMPVVFVPQANQGAAAARNAGVAASSGDLVVFIDDDVVVTPECIAAHVAAHESRTEAAVVIGPLLTPEKADLEPWVRWEQAMLTKQYDAMARGDWVPTARQFYTGNASLTRECFDASGGFDPTLRRAEDVELAYRLHDGGVTFVFEFGARAFHHASRSYDAWKAIARAYGRNDVIFWRDRGQRWLLPTIRAEYEERHPLTRAYTRVGLAAPPIGQAMAHLAPLLARWTDRVRLAPLGRGHLSAVYNLAYYEGLVEELGDLHTFLQIEPVSFDGGDPP